MKDKSGQCMEYIIMNKYRIFIDVNAYYEKLKIVESQKYEIWKTED